MAITRAYKNTIKYTKQKIKTAQLTRGPGDLRSRRHVGVKTLRPKRVRTPISESSLTWPRFSGGPTLERAGITETCRRFQ
ncbi:unnamed protein product [Dovyalis caffra]|uniref:Uncharacterized protein n=1 Tax=Dovyalis caffra TaxID=77055 RepID=A0AAV1RMP8_9ROSI|nr:unnamed protein product [Dovyalis caffra]